MSIVSTAEGAAIRELTPRSIVIGYFWDSWAQGTSRPEFATRMGVLAATGLVVGDSLFGLAFAGAVGALGDPARLAVVGDDFAPAAEWIGLALAVTLVRLTYARTRKLAKAGA